VQRHRAGQRLRAPAQAALGQSVELVEVFAVEGQLVDDRRARWHGLSGHRRG
jgi:hypothetical protein